jgi:hypothetical protein
MSPRRRKARGRTGELPLHSARWMPAAEAHRMLTGSVGDSDLAAKDLTAAVADKRSDKRLPCMQRATASYIAPDQDREIVPLSFWDKHEFGFDPVSEKLQIWTKGLYAVEFRCRAVFFVWKPKFEEISPALAASAAPHAASSARDDEPTPSNPEGARPPQQHKPGPKFRDEWPTEVATELIRLALYDRELLGNVAGLVKHMREFLDDELGWSPDDKALCNKIKALLKRVR